MTTYTSPYYDNSMVLWSVLGVINTMGSILTLLLIYKLHKVNGYMKMVVAMTLAQTVFDIGLLLFNTNVLFWQYTQLFLGIFCGTATGLWSLVIVFVMVYIITTRRYFDVEGRFNAMFMWITATNLFFSIACLVTYINHQAAFADLFFAFNMIRVLVIVLTSALICVAVFQLQSMGVEQQSPVKVLATRLCWYPLVQLVSRLPITVYQLHYNTPLREFAFLESASGVQKFWFITSVIFTPSAGLGNLIAFLKVQPDVNDLLWSYFPCVYTGKPKPARRKSNRAGGMTVHNSVRESDMQGNPMFVHHETRESSLYNVGTENDTRHESESDVAGAAAAAAAFGDSNPHQRPESPEWSGMNSPVDGDTRRSSVRSTQSDMDVSQHVEYEFLEFKDMDEEELVKQVTNHPNRASTRTNTNTFAKPAIVSNKTRISSRQLAISSSKCAAGAMPMESKGGATAIIFDDQL